MADGLHDIGQALAGAVRQERVALLSIDSAMLLMPSREIRTLETILDLETARPPLHGVGWIAGEKDRWPVYCLSGELERMVVPGPHRRVCAVLQADDQRFGLLCDTVSLVGQHQVPRQPLPSAMARDDSPVLALAMLDGRLACVTSAGRIHALLTAP